MDKSEIDKLLLSDDSIEESPLEIESSKSISTRKDSVTFDLTSVDNLKPNHRPLSDPVHANKPFGSQPIFKPKSAPSDRKKSAKSLQEALNLQSRTKTPTSETYLPVSQLIRISSSKSSKPNSRPESKVSGSVPLEQVDYQRSRIIEQLMEDSNREYEKVMGLANPIEEPMPKEMLNNLYAQMDKFLIRKEAAYIIWNFWTRYKHRKIFRIMKDSIMRAEYLMSVELLKKISPKESHILADPLIQARVRFRLGGESFPPKVYFKIYTSNQGVHYFSGHRIIAAGSKADYQSCGYMGKAHYYETVVQDNHFNHRNPRVSQFYQVTNRKEHIQYLNYLDSKPSYLGGRNNTWREISFDVSKWRVYSWQENEVDDIAPVVDWILSPFRRKEASPVDIPSIRTQIESKKTRKQKRIEKYMALYGFSKPDSHGDSNASSPFKSDDEMNDFEGYDADLDNWVTSLSLEDVDKPVEYNWLTTTL